MKPTTTAPQAPRVAAVGLSASVTDAPSDFSSGPAPDALNAFAQLQTLDAEIRAIEEKRDRARQDLFADLIARIRGQVETLLHCGFTRAEIAKALDLTATTSKASRPGSYTGSKPKKGPSTFDGWLSLFRKRGQRAYATKNHINAADIPPTELANIDEEAKKRATAKCSAPPSPTNEATQ